MANGNVPDAKEWVTGEVITADALNQLEQNAHNAYALADTNEKDIDSIDHIVQGIATDTSGEVALKDGIAATGAIADGSVTAAKLGSDDSAPEIVDMTITCVDCECDNFIGGVEKNHQYKGTFKPNDGYMLAEVAVVLGGEDVTEKYYDKASCTVKVPRVNEFLQIKAVANPIKEENAGQE